MTESFTWPTTVIDGIWRLNLQAALLGVLVAIVCLLCGKWLAPRWKSMLWMLVFLRICIPVSLPFAFSLTNLISPGGDGTVHTFVPVAANDPRPQQSPVIVAPAPSLSPSAPAVGRWSHRRRQHRTGQFRTCLCSRG